MCSWAGREYLAKSVITKSGSAREAGKDFCGKQGIRKKKKNQKRIENREMPSPSSYSPLPLTLTKLIFLGTLTWLTMPPRI